MNYWKLSTFAFAAALATVVGTGALPSAHADPQPRMHSAVNHLQDALNDLQNAADDKGGHRVKAIAATREALEQTRKGIAFDNKR
ncbi:MAG TPA: hypothetical protein VFS43_24295 [Polyangiaceae bacterium]|nr:hypothetical protein [Polyangiaceae bacterium]